jgi:hypothetical protein
MYYTDEQHVVFNRRKRQLLFGLIFFIGVSSIGLGVVGFFNTLNAPFASSTVSSGSSDALLSDEELQKKELEALKKKDTDRDGLTDYTEIYIYGTSAYLEDTDSDGDSDGAEIAAKENPNCPKDQDCAPETTGGLPTTNTNSGAGTGSAGLTPGEDLDAEALRQALLQEGMDPDLLNLIDDKTLEELYNEVVSEQSVSSKNNGSTGTGTNETAQTPVGTLTAQEVRALLIENGADPKELEGITDEELLKLAEEVSAEIEKSESNP